VLFSGGIGKVAHDNDQPQKRRQTHGKVRGAEQGEPYAEQREERQNAAHDFFGRALPDAGGGLLVVFAHYVLCCAVVQTFCGLGFLGNIGFILHGNGPP